MLSAESHVLNEENEIKSSASSVENFEALSSSEIWGEKEPLGLDRLN